MCGSCDWCIVLFSMLPAIGGKPRLQSVHVVDCAGKLIPSLQCPLNVLVPGWAVLVKPLCRSRFSPQRGPLAPHCKKQPYRIDKQEEASLTPLKDTTRDTMENWERLSKYAQDDVTD